MDPDSNPDVRTVHETGQPVGRPRSPVVIPWSDPDADLVIGRRFDRVATAMGQATALCSDGRTWSYRDLADASERVAGALHRIRPEGRVLLYLGNSFHHFAAAFGAWKAGWITIPMDPRYPSARNLQILTDADPHLVLTDPSHLDEVRALCDLPVDARPIDHYEPVTDRDREAIGRQVAPDTPSAILYTSGSTGRPKGVLHTHASLTHMTKRRSGLARVRTSDALTLFYSASVMGGLAGVLNALLNGATLHPRDIKNDGFSELDTWLRSHRITLCHCVTSLFRELARSIGPGQSFPDLRLIILGGEQAYPADLETGWKVFGPKVEFSCGIGSTEINTIRQIPFSYGDALPPGRIPFGFPVEGVDVIILNPDRRPVPTGEVGEIVMRSRYLSLGYWRQPEKTRERFIPDPEGSGQPAYLTGDLGRLDGGGCLHGAGRNDHQVKIRGFRVEPGEVNTHLMTQPGIREACTVAIRSEAGSPVLAAFYVATTGATVDPTSLRKALSASLPDYMVPRHLIAMDTLPRTPNGKIDTSALHLPENRSSVHSGRPTTRTEKRLAAIWSTALEQEQVSIDRPFFDLGGNSLTAAAVSARIERTFKRRMPITLFFQYPTIKKLAAWIDDKSVDPASSCLVPIRPDGAGRPLYMIGGMTGEVVFCRQLVELLKTDRPIFALEPDTLSGDRTRFNRIEEVAEDYAKVILSHQRAGPFFIAGYSFGGTVAYELARLLSSHGHVVARLVILDSAAPEQRPVKAKPAPVDPRPQVPGPATGDRIPWKPSRLRFFTLKYWLRGKEEWRRWYWRLKYVRLYELLTRFHYSPPAPWRRCYAYWAALRLSKRYWAIPYDGPTVLFRSDAREEQGDKGWRTLCGDHLQMIRIPGDHGSIFREPNVRILARELDKALDGRW